MSCYLFKIFEFLNFLKQIRNFQKQVKIRKILLKSIFELKADKSDK